MKIYLKIALSLLAVLLAAFTVSCAGDSDEAHELEVVTTLFPQYDFARIIGGEKANVTKLLPWGSESHTYDPSVADIAGVADADMFIYTGKELEKWAVPLAENAASGSCITVDLSERITLLEGVGEDAHIHGEGEDSHSHDYDAHIWTSPDNAIIMADTILESFCRIDPENAEYYTENAEKLKTELSQLSAELSEIAGKYDGRTLYFGGRFAFLYMFDEYSFSYRSPYRGCGEESEPSIKTVAAICSEMKNAGVKYVFTEEMSEGKIAKSIAEETGAAMLLLHSCHNLTANQAERGESYVSIMRSNVANLRTALGISG